MIYLKSQIFLFFSEALSMYIIYIPGFSYWQGWGESPPTRQEFAHLPHLEKFPSRLPLTPKLNDPSPAPLPPLNNNFHVITQWKLHF